MKEHDFQPRSPESSNPTYVGFDQISKERWEAVLIPERLKEVASGNLRMEYLFVEDNAFIAATILRHNSPQFDSEIIRKRLAWEKEREEKKDYIPDISGIESIPGFFQNYYRDVSLEDGDGKLFTSSDQAVLLADLNKNGEVLDITNYRDIKNYRRKGIGKSFFEQLNVLAEEMGIRYIVGTNERERDEIDGGGFTDLSKEGHNIDFFLNVLGMVRLTDIQDQYWEKLISGENYNKYFLPKYAKTYIVKFLYEEDKAKMLR